MNRSSQRAVSEEWRVCGRDHRYSVSSLGRVRGVKGQVLSPVQGGGNHVKIGLGRHNWVYVHVLVLEAFVGPCPDGMECRHLNGVDDDNRLSNIEWNTRNVNTKDRKAHGQLNACHKLSTDDANEIKRLLAEGVLSLTEIGRKFGCTAQNVRRIRNQEIHL